MLVSKALGMVYMTVEEARQFVAAGETLTQTVRLAIDDLKIGRTSLALARLETLVKLNPVGGIQNYVAHHHSEEVASLNAARQKRARDEVGFHHDGDDGA